MNVRDYLLSLRVDVPPPASVVASQLLGALGICRCADCKPLADWLMAEPSYGSLTLVQCSSLITQIVKGNCDECLAYGQLINRRVGQVICAADELPAAHAHALEEAQAKERDRLDSRRITLWFELSLACQVGAARARNLVLNVIKTPFTLSHLIQQHNDENGLTFDESLRESIRFGAKVYLEHYGHLVKQ